MVHCRIGSLEIEGNLESLDAYVHCRIGSLEMIFLKQFCT